MTDQQQANTAFFGMLFAAFVALGITFGCIRGCVEANKTDRAAFKAGLVQHYGSWVKPCQPLKEREKTY